METAPGGPLHGSWREWLMGKCWQPGHWGRCLAGNGGREGGEMYFGTWEGFLSCPRPLQVLSTSPVIEFSDPHGSSW